MSVRYDDKGKYYTEIISKYRVPSTIQTHFGRILGNLHVRQEDRVSDELNRDEQFLAITDAVIHDNQGEEIFTPDFVLVNRDHVVWIIPDENNILNAQQSEESV